MRWTTVRELSELGRSVERIDAIFMALSESGVVQVDAMDWSGCDELYSYMVTSTKALLRGATNSDEPEVTARAERQLLLEELDLLVKGLGSVDAGDQRLLELWEWIARLFRVKLLVIESIATAS